LSLERSHNGIADLLKRSAARYPQRAAIVCGKSSWTYREFSQACDRLASGLAGIGVGRADRVAILARNSHAFAAMRFALAQLGATLVPINFMLNRDEAAYILKHSGAQLLATDSEHASVARSAARTVGVAQMLWMPGEEPSDPDPGMLNFETLADSKAQLADVAIEGSDIAQIIYTSGTESLPKGAVLTHEAVIHQYVSCIVDGEMSADDVVLHSLPLYHCAQLDCFLGPSIYLGSTNIITGRPIPENLLLLMQTHRITSFFAPPTIWISLLRCPLFDGCDLSALGKGYYGASIMPVEILREIMRRLPAVRLWNFYGQTEIAPLATVLKPADQFRKAGSAGRPALNVQTRVVDDQMRDVVPGEIGEIVHRSPQLMRGYFNDETRTAQAFEGGWFHSGDLACIDDEGFITVVDRKKDMIKSGGENVASREVEEAIYEIPGVSEVAVIGLPHPRWIEAVTAVLVLKTGEGLTGAQVIGHCAARMAHFKVPKSVVFIDVLPKNPSGKLLKRELRLRFGDHYSADGGDLVHHSTR
jgi:fatty-acyl-CoA synthase